jgi:hypothetical protein
MKGAACRSRATTFGVRIQHAAAAVVLGGCNAILGLDPQHLRPDAGSGGDAGAAVDSATDAPANETGGAVTDGAGGSAYAREVMADTPLLYYRFGESGGLVVRDEMHAHDAAYPSFDVRFKVPGALSNDPDTAIALGGQASIQAPETADFTGTANYSVEVWLKVDAPPTNISFIIDHETWPDRRGWDIVLDATGFSFERYGNAVNISVGAPPLAIGTWSYVLYTWDGTTGRVFINRVLAREATSAFDIAAVPGGFRIGGQNCSCSSTFYSGALDELAIYDKVLPGDRSQAHFQAAGR